MYDFIKCPITKKLFHINSERGSEIINNYNYFQYGGAIQKFDEKGDILNLKVKWKEDIYNIVYEYPTAEEKPPTVLNLKGKISEEIGIRGDLWKLLKRKIGGLNNEQLLTDLQFNENETLRILDMGTSSGLNTKGETDLQNTITEPVEVGIDVEVRNIKLELEQLLKQLIEMEFSYDGSKLILIVNSLYESINTRESFNMESVLDNLSDLIKYKDYLENLGSDRYLISQFTFRFMNAISPIYENFIQRQFNSGENIPPVATSIKSPTTTPSPEEKTVPQSKPTSLWDGFFRKQPISVRGGGNVQLGGRKNDIPMYKSLKDCMMVDGVHRSKIEKVHDFGGEQRTDKPKKGSEGPTLYQTDKIVKKRIQSYFDGTGEKNSSNWNALICGKTKETAYSTYCKNIPPKMGDNDFDIWSIYDNMLTYSNNRTVLKLTSDKKNYLEGFFQKTSLESRSFNFFCFNPFLEEIAANDYSEDDLRYFYKNKLTFVGTAPNKGTRFVVARITDVLNKIVTLRDPRVLSAVKMVLKKSTEIGKQGLRKAAEAIGITTPDKVTNVWAKQMKKLGRSLKCQNISKDLHNFFNSYAITGYTIDGDPAGGSGLQPEFFVGTTHGLKNLLNQYNPLACIWDPRTISIIKSTGDFRAGIICYDAFANFTRRRLAVSINKESDEDPYWKANMECEENLGRHLFPKDSLHDGRAERIKFNLYYNTNGTDWQNIKPPTPTPSVLPMDYYPHGSESIFLPRLYFPTWTTEDEVVENFEYLGQLYGTPGVDLLRIIAYVCYVYITQLDSISNTLYELWKNPSLLKKTPPIKMKELLEQMRSFLEQPHQKKSLENVGTIIKFISRVISDGIANGAGNTELFADYITNILFDLKCSGDRGISKANRYMYFKYGIRLLHMANDKSAIISSTFNCRGSIAAGKIFTVGDITDKSIDKSIDTRLIKKIKDSLPNPKKWTHSKPPLTSGFFATINSHDLIHGAEIDSGDLPINFNLYKKIRKQKKEIGKRELREITQEHHHDVEQEKTAIKEQLKMGFNSSESLEKWLLGSNWINEMGEIVDDIFDDEVVDISPAIPESTDEDSAAVDPVTKGPALTGEDKKRSKSNKPRNRISELTSSVKKNIGVAARSLLRRSPRFRNSRNRRSVARGGGEVQKGGGLPDIGLFQGSSTIISNIETFSPKIVEDDSTVNLETIIEGWLGASRSSSPSPPHLSLLNRTLVDAIHVITKETDEINTTKNLIVQMVESFDYIDKLTTDYLIPQKADVDDATEGLDLSTLIKSFVGEGDLEGDDLPAVDSIPYYFKKRFLDGDETDIPPATTPSIFGKHLRQELAGTYIREIKKVLFSKIDALWGLGTSAFIKLTNLSIIKELLNQCTELAIQIFNNFPCGIMLEVDNSRKFMTDNKLTSLRSEAWCDASPGDVPLYINKNWWRYIKNDGDADIDIADNIYSGLPDTSETGAPNKSDYKFISSITDIPDDDRAKYFYNKDDLDKYKKLEIFYTLVEQIKHKQENYFHQVLKNANRKLTLSIENIVEQEESESEEETESNEDEEETESNEDEDSCAKQLEADRVNITNWLRWPLNIPGISKPAFTKPLTTIEDSVDKLFADFEGDSIPDNLADLDKKIDTLLSISETVVKYIYDFAECFVMDGDGCDERYDNLVENIGRDFFEFESPHHDDVYKHIKNRLAYFNMTSDDIKSEAKNEIDTIKDDLGCKDNIGIFYKILDNIISGNLMAYDQHKYLTMIDILQEQIKDDGFSITWRIKLGDEEEGEEEEDEEEGDGRAGDDEAVIQPFAEFVPIV